MASDSFGSSTVRSNMPGTLLQYNTMRERRRKISIQTSSEYCQPKNSKQPAAPLLSPASYTQCNGNGKEKLIDLRSPSTSELRTVKPETSQTSVMIIVIIACDRHFDPPSIDLLCGRSKAFPPVSNRPSSSPIDHHIGCIIMSLACS